jgi:hypothetical protein
VIRLSSQHAARSLAALAAPAFLLLTDPAYAAAGSGGSGGEVLPVQILHNIYQWCVDGATWLIPMALIAGVIHHLCIPNRRDVPKAAAFLLTMALIIIPCALAAPAVISKLQSLGGSAWGGAASHSQPSVGGGRGTP